jgi:small subunit ribosomal protein S6
LNAYEITFIIRPDLDTEGMRAAADAVNRRLESGDGELIATYPWGIATRRLAFPINDFGDGYYVTTVFNYNSDALPELENFLRLNESVLRHLIVQATEMNIRQAQQRAHLASQPAAQPVPQGEAAPVGAPAGTPQVETAAPVAAPPPAPVEAVTETVAPEPEPEPAVATATAGAEPEPTQTEE